MARGASPASPAVRPSSNKSSNAQLLLKNLRLLDLDEEIDWPGIDIDTFSARSSVGTAGGTDDYERRVYCATWIVSRLFAVYDADADGEGKGEGKQSARQNTHKHRLLSSNDVLAARAAFFKRLSELKRTGILAADVSIRKAVYDECTGAEFEELLAVFSSVVLIHVLEQRSDKCIVHQSIGRQRFDLNTQVLELAYRVSLTQHIRQRALLQKRWSNFSRALEKQSEMLNQRAKRVDSVLPLGQQKRVPQRTVKKLEDFLKENWIGTNQEWINVLLQGTQQRPKGDVLDLPSADIWQHACDDTLHTVRPQQGQDCLQTFQNRVEEQKRRLEKWKAATQTYRTMQNQHQPTAGTPSVSEKGKLPDRKYSLRSTQRTSRHRASLTMSLGTLPATSAIPEADHLKIGKPIANTGKRLSSTAHYLQVGTNQGIPVASRRLLPRPSQKDNRENVMPSVVRTERVQNDKPTKSSQDDTMILDTTVLREEPDIQNPPLTLAERTQLSLANMATRLDRTATTTRKQHIESPTPIIEEISSTSKETISTARTSRPTFSEQQSTTSQSGQQAQKPRMSAIYPPTSQPKASRTEDPGEMSFFDETIIDLDEVDIFKSRPKVALSPVLAPRASEDVSMLSLVAEDADAGSEDDFS